MKKRIINNLFKILLVINTSLFIISLSISFAILFRPFYYANIKILNLEKETGYSYKDIKEAYDNVIDYSLNVKDFSTGKLKYSEEGFNHFKDCKALFNINFIILILSLIIIVIKKILFNDIKLFKHSIGFWSGISIIFTFLSIIIFTLIMGFSKSFELFHKLFFPGKENWLFDPVKDEIIRILPNSYFLNVSILVISIIFIISILLIIRDLYINKKYKLRDL